MVREQVAEAHRIVAADKGGGKGWNAGTYWDSCQGYGKGWVSGQDYGKGWDSGKGYGQGWDGWGWNSWPPGGNPKGYH